MNQSQKLLYIGLNVQKSLYKGLHAHKWIGLGWKSLNAPLRCKMFIYRKCNTHSEVGVKNTKPNGAQFARCQICWGPIFRGHLIIKKLKRKKMLMI